jgi:hypothetical protein
MGLIIYIPKEDESGRRLQEIVAGLVWQDTIEIYYTLTRLFFRLRHADGNEDVALLLASSRKDLEALVGARNLLSGLRIVLVLPDSEQNTIALGHLLRPRFVSTRDQGFSDLSLVLEKMSKTAFPQPYSEEERVLNRGGA